MTVLFVSHVTSAGFAAVESKYESLYDEAISGQFHAHKCHKHPFPIRFDVSTESDLDVPHCRRLVLLSLSLFSHSTFTFFSLSLSLGVCPSSVHQQTGQIGRAVSRGPRRARGRGPQRQCQKHFRVFFFHFVFGTWFFLGVGSGEWGAFWFCVSLFSSFRCGLGVGFALPDFLGVVRRKK